MSGQGRGQGSSNCWARRGHDADQSSDFESNCSRDSNNRAEGTGGSDASNEGSPPKKMRRIDFTSTSRNLKQMPVSNHVVEEDSDSEEPKYCTCYKTSHGDMVACDNHLCPLEWFHFRCVQVKTKPKGEWFCPNCRADKDKPSVMKPHAVVVEQLRTYNKEFAKKAAALIDLKAKQNNKKKCFVRKK